MKTPTRTLLSVLFFASTATAAQAAPLPSDLIPARGGPIRITPIYHASFQIEYRGKVIQVDPFSAGDYSSAKKADYVFITHTHPDHLDKAAIRRISTDCVEIIGPQSVTSQLKDLEAAERGAIFSMPNGQTVGWDDTRSGGNFSMTLTAVPMYNLKRGPKPGQKFHPKGQFNGYVLTLGGKRIYIAGDTEATPEMKALKNIDVAFLPMNLPYTMTPEEAAVGARAFRPKIVYPYHYRFPFTKANNNPQQFANALKGSGIQVRLRGWYAHPAKK